MLQLSTEEKLKRANELLDIVNERARFIDTRVSHPGDKHNTTRDQLAYQAHRDMETAMTELLGLCEIRAWQLDRSLGTYNAVATRWCKMDRYRENVTVRPSSRMVDMIRGVVNLRLSGTDDWTPRLQAIQLAAGFPLDQETVRAIWLSYERFCAGK